MFQVIYKVPFSLMANFQSFIQLKSAPPALSWDRLRLGRFSRERQCLSSFAGFLAFPGSTVVKEPACQCRRCKRCGFNTWVGEIPWGGVGKWQSTLVFLPGKSQGQRSPVGYSSWGHKELDMTEWLSMDACMPFSPSHGFVSRKEGWER